MLLKDVALFAHSALNATSRNGIEIDSYWDSHADMHRLIRRLSDTESPERREIRSVLREYSSRTLLDAGCGPAVEMAGYMRHGIPISYIGADRSEYMLKEARNRNPSEHFLGADVERLPLRDGSFDAVLLRHILEHLPGYENALKEALRVSKQIVIVDFFHRLLPVGRDIYLKDRRGFRNNWYSRPKFEHFLYSEGARILSLRRTTGTRGQTAEIYVLARQG